MYVNLGNFSCPFYIGFDDQGEAKEVCEMLKDFLEARRHRERISDNQIKRCHELPKENPQQIAMTPQQPANTKVAARRSAQRTLKIFQRSTQTCISTYFAIGGNTLTPYTQSSSIFFLDKPVFSCYSHIYYLLEPTKGGDNYGTFKIWWWYHRDARVHRG